MLQLVPPPAERESYDQGVNVAGSDRERILIEKIRSLPPDRWSEVEDFIDFVRMLDARTATALSEPAFAAIWDNPEDAEYDRLLVEPSTANSAVTR
jgi:hypothetical protein